MKGRIYPRKPCLKCGAEYPSNVLPQHQDQCSGDTLIEVAKKTKPSTGVSFVWANWNNKTLHAIDEEQVATSQEAFCEKSPINGALWGRADEMALGLDPQFPQHALPRCPECANLTRDHRDITMTVNRAVDREDKRGDAADNRARKARWHKRTP